MVGESRKVNTIFFASNRFVELSLFHVVGVNAFVVTRADQILALVIKIQRGHIFGRFFLAREECLEKIGVRLRTAALNVWSNPPYWDDSKKQSPKLFAI